MSDDNGIELTRRKVLGGLTAIGAAGAATGAGTMALFSDTEQSSGNTVTAGTLDLTTTAISSTSLGVTDAKPGDQGYVVFELTNDGSLDGSLDVNIGSVDSGGTFTASLVTDAEGDDPESETGTPGSDGELDENLNIGVYIESTGEDQGVHEGSTYSGGSADIGVKTLNKLIGSYDTDVTLNSGNSTDLVLTYEIPSGTGNQIQGDEVAFDLQVELNQTDGQ